LQGWYKRCKTIGVISWGQYEHL